MRISVALFFLLVYVHANGQTGFGGFFKAAQDAPTVAMFDMQVDYLNKKPYRLAPLQKVEFRTESNRLDIARQEYALRINPSNPWELRQNNRYFSALKSTIALEKGIILKEVLFDRYNLIIELVTFAGLKDLAQRELELTQTYIAMLEKQQLSGSFDGEDYVDLKLEEMDKSVDVDKAQFEVENAARKVVAIYPEAATHVKSWSLKDIVTIEQIQKLLDSLETAPHEATSLSYFQQKINLADREYALEKNNINLGYFQAKYEEFRIVRGDRPWSIGFGVTIPVVNPNKGDMAKRKLKAIESQQEFKEAKLEFTKDQVRLRGQLTDLIASYRSIEDKIKTLNVGALARTLNSMQKSNPVAGVRFQANIIKLEELALKLRQNILLTYTEWLFSTDALQQLPLTNYLSKNLETL